MLHTKGSVIFRVMTAACISALVLASCGNTDSSSNRNGRLNSALCFDTQDEKDAAIADAQKALDQATPPTLEESSPSNNGGRATLAFIGPQLWWMRAASGASTTTTTQPAATSTSSTSSTSTSSTVASSSKSTDSTDVATDSTETSVPLVGDMVLQQLQDELEAVTNAPLCDSTDSSIAQATYHKCVASWTYGQVDGLSAEPSIDTAASQDCIATLSRCIIPENSNSCEVTAESNGVQVFSTTLDLSGMSGGESRLVTFDWTEGDVSETSDESADTTVDTTVDTAVDTAVDTGSTITCTASVLGNGASFDCARPLNVTFFYHTNSGGDENPVWLFGNEQTAFGPLDDVRDIYLAIFSSGVLVFNQAVNPGTYDFEVPIVEESSDSELVNEGDGEGEGEGEGDEPLFSGTLNPSIGENSVSFTIPDDYSAPYFFLQLYVECEDQTVEAMVYKDGQAVASLVDMGPYRVLNEGLCGVWLFVDEFFESPVGGTFDVIVSASTTTRIMWDGTVPLVGEGVSGEYGTDVDTEGIEWEDYWGDVITADAFFSISIPSGGRHLKAVGITNVYEEVAFDEPFVDPMLVLYDANGDIVDLDDDSGDRYGSLSSLLSLFLAEGEYTLRATTFDIYFPEESSEFALSTYELEVRIGSASVDTVKNDSSNDVVNGDAPTTDLPEETAVQIESIGEAPANLETPQQMVALPIDQLISSSNKDSDPLPVIPAGVTEVVCDSECLSTLREAAGIEEGIVTIQIGGEAIEIQPSARKAVIPVRHTAKNIVVTIAPTDGGQPVVLSTEALIISPLTFPTKLMEGVESVTKINQRDSGIPTYLIVVLVALALAIAIGLVRRQKVRLPQ